MMIGDIVAVHSAEGLVDSRIEWFANGGHGRDLKLAKHLAHLFNNELHARAQLLDRARGLQGKLEMIEDRQKLLDHAAGGVVAELGPFPLGALAGIIELRLQTGQPIQQLIALGFQPIEFGAGNGSKRLFRTFRLGG